VRRPDSAESCRRGRRLDQGKFDEPTGPGQASIRRLRRTLSIVPVTPQEQHRAELFLDVLKAIGIILAGFPAAAINALVAR
jgi:hypothetical protein